MKNTIQILFITLFFSIGCRPKPLSIDLPQAEQKLVISSQIIPNAAMIVTVSKTMDATGFSQDNGDTLSSDILNQLLVDSAFVTVSYNGIVDTLIRIPGVPGIFFSLAPQFLDVNYNLYVKEYEKGRVVTSSAKMLPMVSLDTVTSTKSISGGFPKIDIAYSFNDPQNEDNWYMVNFYAFKDSTEQSGTNFDFTENSNVVKETIVLNDKNFSTSLVSLTQNLVGEEWDKDTLFISLSNISEGYYDYVNSRLRGGSILTSLTSEPINYPTNIIGGLGFFTTHKPSIKIIPVN